MLKLNRVHLAAADVQDLGFCRCLKSFGTDQVSEASQHMVLVLRAMLQGV